MKTWVKVIGGIVVLLILALVVLRFTGLDPSDRMPGLWLKGDLVTTPVTDWSFTEKYDTIMIQTRSWYGLPHSVTVRCDTDNGKLFISSQFFAGMQFPRDKSWAAYAVRDPHVRLKIGNQLYDVTVSHVTDQAELAALHDAKVKKYHWRFTPGEVIHWFEVMPG